MARAKSARVDKGIFALFPGMAAMSGPAGDEPHLLVVDDDERLRALLQRYLSGNGYRVTAAPGAAEARALMKGMAFDLLILDVMMPGESGLELTQSVRKDSKVPILMLTARGDAGRPHRGAWNWAPTITSPSRSSRANFCCG